MVEEPFEPANVYLVGFHVGASSASADFYTLVLLHDGSVPGQDRPLTRDGAILWFSKPETAVTALEVGDESFREARLNLGEVAIVYDLAEAVSLTAHGGRDENGTIVDCLNILIDMVKATGFPMPSAYLKTLSEFADHTTFSKDIGAFFTDPRHDRIAVLDALTWAVGAITLNSAIFSTE